MKKKGIVLFFMWSLLNSCSTIDKRVFCIDDEKCITVFDKDDSKYIFLKKETLFSKAIKTEKYIELDMKNVTTSGHALFVCWIPNKSKFQIACPDAVIKINKFEVNELDFRDSLELNEKGIPTQHPYSNKSCFVFDYESGTIFPRGHAKLLKD